MTEVNRRVKTCQREVVLRADRVKQQLYCSMQVWEALDLSSTLEAWTYLVRKDYLKGILGVL